MQTNNHKAREWAKQNVLSAAEVAGLLNMTRSQVARLTNCGRLKPLKYSRKNGTALYIFPMCWNTRRYAKKKHCAENTLQNNGL